MALNETQERKIKRAGLAGLLEQLPLRPYEEVIIPPERLAVAARQLDKNAFHALLQEIRDHNKSAHDRLN